MSKPILFNGVVPGNYQDILTPFLFDGFSADLAERTDFTGVQDILELAGGTGSFTRQLVKHMGAGSRLTVTDLQADMLEVAKKQVAGDHISWEEVDMTAIPYSDARYDLIFCQFGLMLVPEKEKALSEIYRVLKKGGRFVFTVWADAANNPAWDICGKVIAQYMGINPMERDPGPFALAKETTNLQLLKQAGFAEVRSTLVTQISQIQDAELAAKGFIQGLPLFSMIKEKAPSLLEQIEETVAAQFAVKLGDHPLQAPSQAWVFEAIK